jgi:NTP pyrophosphatase (non-canonical NTP hydrolase)
MHLEEMKKEIESLVLTKGFYNKPEDIPKKGENQQKIAEELIDVIFYILDASRLACPDVNMDEMFQWKLAKNLGRPFQYGEGHRNNQHAP